MPIWKKTFILIGDVFALYLSLAIALAIRYGFPQLGMEFQTHLIPFSFVFVVWILIFYATDFYHQKNLTGRGTPANVVVSGIFWSALASVLLFYLFINFFKLTPKTNLFLFSFIFLFLDYFFRKAALRIFSSGALRVLFLGDSPLLSETIELLNKTPHPAYRNTHWIKSFEPSNTEGLDRLIKERKIEVVVADVSRLDKNVSAILVKEIFRRKLNFVNFTDFYEMIFEKVALGEIQDAWFIKNITTKKPIYDGAKRVFDFVFGLILFILLAPITLTIALLTKITSPGPVIYKQARMGKNGEAFTVYKFRTMAVSHNGPLWTEPNDNRLTGLGKLLRFTHLDEIPQLINIIFGKLSFTGPRPERIELAEKYRTLPYYDIRHIIKPGLSGWAQINYKPSASVEEAYEKLKHDLFYIKYRSFFLDLRIIIKTAKYILSNHK